MDDNLNNGMGPLDPNDPLNNGNVPGDGMNLNNPNVNGGGVPVDENGVPIAANKIKKRHGVNAAPNLQGKTISDILNLASRLQREDLSKFSIDSIPVEHRMVEEIHDMSPILKDWVKKGDGIIKTYPEMADDLMLSLYKPEPEMLLPDEMHNNYKVNHNIVDGLTGDPQFELLRDYCQMDMFNSALASEILHEKAIKKLEELRDEFRAQGGENIIDSINEAIATQQDVAALMEKAQAINQIQQQLQQSGQQNQQINNMSNQVCMDLATAMKLADARAKRLEKIKSTNQDQLQKIEKAMKSGVNSAIKNVCEVSNYIQQWGFDPGPEVRVSFEQKMTAINKLRNSKKLKKFGDIIGALKEMARREQKIKSKNGSAAITGVTIGDNIAKILPSELMLLKNPTTRKNFFKRLYEKSLLQYEMTAMEKKGRGPLVVCVDISGSMNGDPEIWAKSFAIALLDIAQIQKRNYCYISFQSRVEDVFIQEKGYLDPAAVVEICEKSTGGGTDFEDPLTKALEILKDSRFKKGDIVFVTDGECSVSEKFLKDFLKVKEEKEFAVRSIVINTGYHASDATLKQFSDEVISLSSIADLGADSKVAEQIFREV